MKKKIKAIFKFISSNIYLIIPVICICLWSIFYVLKENFDLNIVEFIAQYNAGKLIFTDPTKLYDPELRYFYLPSFAIVLSVTVCLFPFTLAHYIYYSLLTLFAVIFVFEYNKILSLLNLDKKYLRFIFLMIISNGMVVFYQFYMTQSKFFIAVLFFIIIKRELRYRIEKKEKNTKFFVINYGLFIFAIGIFPYFVFFLLIYIFHNIQFNTLFKKTNLKKYGIVLSWFIVQNFLILIYPSLIFDILWLFIRHNQTERQAWGFPLFYLKEWPCLILDDYTFVILTSTILTFIISIVLIFRNNLKIEENFAYFSLFIVLFSIFGERVLLVLYPFVLLLFIPLLNQNEKGFDFIKKNKIIIIGIFSIAALSFMPPAENIYKYLPLLEQYPFIIFMYLRWIILLILLCGSTILLYFGKKNLSHQNSKKF